LSALRCGEHASQVYAAFAALLQSLSRESYIPLLAGNALLTLAAAFAFHSLATKTFPDDSLAPERSLLTAAFIVQPALVGATLQPSLDLPLVPAFLGCLTFLLARRWMAAVLAGLALAFTKETGVLLYAVLIACLALWAAWEHRKAFFERPRLPARVGVLAIPLAAFAAYLLVRAVRPPAGGNVLWNTSSTGESILHQFLVPKLDLHLIKYFALLLVLSFAWIPAALFYLDVVVAAMRSARRLGSRTVPGANRQGLGFLILVTLATTYALTRFTTFGHIRYFLALLPLVLLLAGASVLRLGFPPAARRAGLTIYVLLLAATDVRTIDPVSMRAYGTFAFGEHRMLRMTSITHECCGAGQDQLAYSAEFTVLATLLNRALEPARGSDSVAIIVPDSVDWMLIGRLDRATGRRTLSRRNVTQPRVVQHWKIIAGRESAPRSALFLALPTGNADRALLQLSRIYAVGDRRRYMVNGYTLDTYAVTLRDAPPP
jgi:hypothetical protein